MKDIRIAFAIMCVGTVIFTIVCFFKPHTNLWFGNEAWNFFDKGWTSIGEDNVEVPIEVPCRTYYPEGQDAVIKNTLPAIEDGDVLAVHSNLQDIRIYVADQEIKHYSNEDIRKIGKETYSAWIIVKLDESFSHQPVRIVFSSIHNEYKNMIDEIYLGNETGIIFHIWDSNSIIYVIGIAMLAIGLFFIIFAIILRTSDKQESALRQILYIGIFSFIVGLWLICKCEARQFYTESIDYTHHMSYILFMMFPIPLLAYVKEIERQSGRTILHIFQFVYAINYIINMLLAICGVKSFAQTFIVTHTLFLLTLAYFIFIFIRMLFQKSEYSMPFIIATLVFTGWCCAGLIFANITKCYDMIRVISQAVCVYVIITGAGAMIELSKKHNVRKQMIAENEAKSRFLANLSHELRTPMYAISGMADLISETDLTWDNKARINIIRHSTESMLGIINDILESSKLENGESKLIESEYELLPILQELRELTRYRIGDKNVIVEFKVKDEVPSSFYGDGDKVKQILNNLLSYASKFTSIGSIKLDISFDEVSNRKGNLVFKLTNTGAGIDRSRVAKMEGSKTAMTSSMDLSLVNCKKMIKLMTGNMQQETNEDGSNTIHITIPQLVMSQKAVKEEQIINTDKLPADYVIRSIKSPNSKILVVDDNRVNLQVAQAMIARYGGEVVLADSGKKALELLSQSMDFDLVFMDLMMPDMDGYETVRRIRSKMKDYFKKVPIVALTANAVVGTKEKALDAGMNAYLSKPVRTSELDEIMKTYLPQQKQVSLDNRNEIKKQEDEMKQYAYHDIFRNLHGIDLADGMNYCMNKPEVYVAVLKAFTTPELENAINTAWEKKNIKDYAIYVHSIKSSAKNIGANTLSDMAYELEMAAKSKDVAFLESNHDACMDEYRKVIEAAKETLELMEQDETVKKDKVLSKSELKNLMDRLKQTLIDMDPVVSKEILENLFSVKFSDASIDDSLHEIYDYVENYDFDEALEKAQSIKIN